MNEIAPSTPPQPDLPSIQPIPPEDSKPPISPAKIIVAVLILLLVGGGAFGSFYYFRSSKSSIQEKQGETASTTVEANQAPTNPDEFPSMGTGPEIPESVLSSLTPEEREQAASLLRSATCRDSNGKQMLSFLTNSLNGIAFEGHSLGPVEIAPNGDIYADIDGGCGYRSTDGGLTWKLFLAGAQYEVRDASGKVIEGGPIRFLRSENVFVFNPNNPKHFYGFQYGSPTLETTDGGNHWHLVLIDGRHSLIDIALSKTDPLLRYALMSTGFEEPVPQLGPGTFKDIPSSKLYVSRDGGQRWEVIHDTSPAKGKNLCSYVALTPNGSHLYLGCSDGLWGSSDGGATFIRLLSAETSTPGLTVPQIFGATNEVAFGTSPSVSLKAIYLSYDFGKTWIIGRNSPLFSIIVNPQDKNEVFGINSDDNSLHRSTDGGKQWKPIAKFPSGISSWSVAIDFAAKKIFAGTGKGLKIFSY